LVVVSADEKQGLDNSEDKFGVLGTGGSILGLFFVRMPRFIVSFGTAKQSTMQNSQKQHSKKGDSKKVETSGASASWWLPLQERVCWGHLAI